MDFVERWEVWILCTGNGRTAQQHGNVIMWVMLENLPSFLKP